MRARPWPIVILAAIHILGPIGNLLLSAWLQRISPFQYLTTFLHQGSWLGQLDFFLLFPLAGVAIYACKKWSYPIFLGVAAFTVYSNYQSWLAHPKIYPLSMFLGSALLDVAFVTYFLIPAVRAPYMNPRLRWWESKSRYIVHLHGLLRDAAGDADCVITDISEGGVFVQTSRKLQSNRPVTVAFSVFDKCFAMGGKIAYQRPDGKGYGIQFAHSPMSWFAMRRLVKGLKTIGVSARGQFDWKADFVAWLKSVVTTGKGLIPDVPNSYVKVAEPIPLKSKTRSSKKMVRKAA